ncbi:unnamed protein product [Macrosiphum euphorbiae]|uniref:Uncharacterized protein n=1 Tax=Macrosiphum euphorbiae TaxID=13131 RepID=A0AAV0VME1_9HEMI|nr:unnamed protein product [Macrosiphum euphorbiae]
MLHMELVGLLLDKIKLIRTRCLNTQEHCNIILYTVYCKLSSFTADAFMLTYYLVYMLCWYTLVRQLRGQAGNTNLMNTMDTVFRLPAGTTVPDYDDLRFELQRTSTVPIT